MKKGAVLAVCTCVLTLLVAFRAAVERNTPAVVPAQGSAAKLTVLAAEMEASEMPRSIGPEVRVSDWARQGVETACKTGLVSPTFDLGGDCTRQVTRLEFARLLVDFTAAETSKSLGELADTLGIALVFGGAGEPLLNESSDFSDTDSAYAQIAARLGIVKGFGGSFRPEDLVVRAEAASMLRRCMGVLGVTDANTQPLRFSDAWAIPRWAIEDVKFVSGRTGKDGTALMGGAGGAFLPTDGFTLEQAILTLVRMHETRPLTGVYEQWKSAPGYNTVQLSLTFGGDCTFGRDRRAAYGASFDEMYDLKGADYFFSGVRDFRDDDLTMVNFEGTLTNAATAAEKTFAFKGRAAYANILRAGSVDVVTLANNHSMDYLQQGYSDTVNYLSPFVAVSGYERLPIVNRKGVNIGFASNTGWSFDSAQKNFIGSAIADLRARGADIIVFYYHWGVEKSYRSNVTQQAIAHYCIDQGADLVIGSHPHVVQETETYRGRQIVYSLGNLVFGGNTNPADKNCLLFRQNYIIDLESRKIVSEKHAALPYSISSVLWRNDYHPVPRS